MNITFASIFVSFVVIVSTLKQVKQWPNHDTSTLKLLQIIHRHGDRTPTSFFPNDPYQNDTQYWPEGVGQLTTKGKYRMYKLGQFIRHHYNQYLGDNYSPREVYARSSIEHRCVESVSCVLSGVYPPNNKRWQWNNDDSDSVLGMVWQPFPIETFMPLSEDNVLTVNSECANADREFAKIFNSEKVKSFLSSRHLFLSNISKTVGKPVDTLKLANRLHDTLDIEHQRNYKWSLMGAWSSAYELIAIEQLRHMAEYLWNVEWNNALIKRVYAGNLLKELNANIDEKINLNQNDDNSSVKLLIYSTHDSLIAVLMHALNIFNGQLIPYGATVLLELHQNKSSGSSSSGSNYFVRIYYYNETLSNTTEPYLLKLPDCDHRSDCPLENYLELTKLLIPNDWDKECGAATVARSDESVDNQLVFNFISVTLIETNLVLTVVLISLIVYNICYAKRRYFYTALKN